MLKLVNQIIIKKKTFLVLYDLAVFFYFVFNNLIWQYLILIWSWEQNIKQRRATLAVDSLLVYQLAMHNESINYNVFFQREMKKVLRQTSERSKVQLLRQAKKEIK